VKKSCIVPKAEVTMVIGEALKSAQFVVDNEGRRTAVLLDIEVWEALMNWIETITDLNISIQALNELQQAGGRPEQAGWLAWDEISEEWGDKEEIETGHI
jgi:hypothetical protein